MITTVYRASRREVVREVANSPNMVEIKKILNCGGLLDTLWRCAMLELMH